MGERKDGQNKTKVIIACLAIWCIKMFQQKQWFLVSLFLPTKLFFRYEKEISKTLEWENAKKLKAKRQLEHKEVYDYSLINLIVHWLQLCHFHLLTIPSHSHLKITKIFRIQLSYFHDADAILLKPLNCKKQQQLLKPNRAALTNQSEPWIKRP